ncbi:hypothetical protein Bca101_039543 [Brassica carinata]
MAVRATVSRFPIDSDALEASGLPWGLTVTPFASKDETGIGPAYGSNGHILPRCENCYAYFNTYCELDQWAWTCSLCGTLNGLPSDAIARYSYPHDSIPEMSSSFVDLELPLDGSEQEMTQARPVYVAAIDLSCKASLLLWNTCRKTEFPFYTYPQVETCKDRIAAALETLRPITSWERSSGAAQGIDGVLMGGRGFGTAMEALFNYLGSEFGNTFALARVFAFISGPPDYGRGQLDTSRYGEQYASKRVDADRALLPEQTPFYKDLATIAVQSGVCVDLFAVTNEYTDLASLKFLSIESGGSLFLYSSTDDSTLPQDMLVLMISQHQLFRMLNRPYAFNCVLRLRTSTEFKPLHSLTIYPCMQYGHFFPDPQYENLQHIICCDSYATYAYDFDFANNTGFSRHSREPPVVQIAFQYTVVVPPEGLQNSELPSSNRTMQFETAQNINETYDSVDPEVVLSLLVHKVILVSLEDGVREGRALLHDWLVILTAQYNDAYNLVQYKKGNKSMSSQIDITFSQCPQLEPLPRLVFALLRNPLLRFHEEGVHPDYRIYLQCLFSVLEPSSLHCGIYPSLVSYSTPDKQAYPRHSLSRAALITSGSPIFFLDAYTTLIVFYTSTADPSLPFPPPQDCLLRKNINMVKQGRSITPKLMFIREGKDDATAFENYLIEEQDVDGSGFASARGFVSFLDDVSQSVAEYMK